MALAMVSWRHHSERITAGAIALLLQAALYWVLSERQPPAPGETSGPRLVARILAATRPNREAPPPLHLGQRLMPVPVMEHPVVPITPAEPQTHAPRPHAPRPAIDWQATIQHEVGAELARLHAPPKIRFDFPPMPAPEASPPEFEWNEARLNRVQRLAEGIIDLGENCFIRLWPPTIPQCDFSSNGDLFEHMHDPRPPPGPNTLP